MSTRRRSPREHGLRVNRFLCSRPLIDVQDAFRLAVPVHDYFAGHRKIEDFQTASFHRREDLYLR